MRQNISVDAITTTTIADHILAALRQVVSAEQGPVALHEPKFDGREWDYVKECIDSGWVSSAGKFVDRFEATWRHTRVPGTVAVVNGTAACT